MKPSDKLKLCGSCEARVPIEVVICPFCASDLSNAKNFSNSKSPSESLANLYNPPYAQRNLSGMDSMKKSFESSKVEVKAAPLEKGRDQSEVLPISLLIIGSNLLTIGILQLLFSEGGLLELQWKSQLWYVYALSALPMLWLGIKFFRKED